MSQWLTFKLSPLAEFFFGQEVVFGGENAKDKRRRSYLVQSGILPQQTSILGALREAILRSNNALIGPGNNDEAARDKAAALVGSTSFSVSQNNADFGLIEAIAPIMLEDQQGNRWQPHPLDDITNKDGTPLKWIQTDDEQWWLENYRPKNDLTTLYVHEDCRRPLDKFFSKDSQTGNRISNRSNWESTTKEKSNEEGLFRQTFQRNPASAYKCTRSNEMPEQFGFLFRVKVSDVSKLTLENFPNIITLGGEQRGFKLEVVGEPAEDWAANYIRPVTYRVNTSWEYQDYQRIVLLSDTYLPESLLNDPDVFICAKAKTLRYFTTVIQTPDKTGRTDNFYYLSFQKEKRRYAKEGRRQSKRYTLLERGGILIAPTSKATNIGQQIIQQSAFRQIGYNYFEIV